MLPKSFGNSLHVLPNVWHASLILQLLNFLDIYSRWEDIKDPHQESQGQWGYGFCLATFKGKDE